MKLFLKIWRQGQNERKGRFVEYEVEANEHMSFLEMLDVLNEKLILKGEEPVVFESDCREGICGTCGFVIDGRPHGPLRGTTVCQLHMRHYNDGDRIVIEPWRANSFPVIKDLVVDRSAFDRIIASGGYISVDTGSAPDGNSIPVNHQNANEAFDAAICIGCGACVAACPNSSAMLFTAAKVSHLALLPQGEIEKKRRVVSMVHTMDDEGFGNCSNIGACSAECPKEIQLLHIARLNRQYIGAVLSKKT